MGLLGHRIGSKLQQVLSCLQQQCRIVPERPESQVAVVAEQPADLPGVMVVVQVKAVRSAVEPVWNALADGALAVLGLIYGFPLFYGNSVVVLEKRILVDALSTRSVVPLSLGPVQLSGGLTPLIVSFGHALLACSGLTARLCVDSVFELFAILYCLAERAYALPIEKDRNGWTIASPVRLYTVIANLFAAKTAIDETLVRVGSRRYFLGRFGHNVRWLLSFAISNSSRHQPQGTLMEGLPPLFFAGVFNFMETSI